jgi:hypothetical protein
LLDGERTDGDGESYFTFGVGGAFRGEGSAGTGDEERGEERDAGGIVIHSKRDESKIAEAWRGRLDVDQANAQKSSVGPGERSQKTRLIASAGIPFTFGSVGGAKEDEPPPF